MTSPKFNLSTSSQRDCDLRHTTCIRRTWSHGLPPCFIAEMSLSSPRVSIRHPSGSLPALSVRIHEPKWRIWRRNHVCPLGFSVLEIRIFKLPHVLLGSSLQLVPARPSNFAHPIVMAPSNASPLVFPLCYGWLDTAFSRSMQRTHRRPALYGLRVGFGPFSDGSGIRTHLGTHDGPGLRLLSRLLL